VNPLRLVSAPLRGAWRALRRTRRTVAIVPDALEAILVLPALSRQLEEIRFSTATLPEMLEEIRRVQADTSTLPVMGEEIARMERTVAAVERNTVAVQQLAEVALPLQGAALRMGRFADRIPQRRNGRTLT
jgi:hypothetical protein